MKWKLSKNVRLQAKKDLICFDQCWNRPKRVPLKKGTIVKVTQSQGTRIGDVEVEVEGTKRNIYGRLQTLFLREGHSTAHPWDIGEIDDEVWTIISGNAEALT